ncbi:TetR/AcrR family transcriptional regulator [Parasalinivibrio latis]|uniref:TetR/AcrR family transcriptional regulator n=1 Tax=Parasalinivibrio latis TaxID=2952610 RepID=UPI0006D23F04
MNERSFTNRKNVATNKVPDKRTLILEATQRLLAQTGFHGLSMQMVAKEAGVAAGTIYRYFADKNDLLAQLHNHVLQHVANKISAGLSDSMSLRQRFEKIWLNTWQMVITNDDQLINRYQFDSLPRNESAEQRIWEKAVFSFLFELFEKGKEEGIFKELDTEVLVAIGIEPVVHLARKQVKGLIELDNGKRQSAMDACWDSVIRH